MAPKLIVEYDTPKTVRFNSETVEDMVALAYVLGMEGDFSKILRYLVSKSLESVMENMDAETREKFASIKEFRKVQKDELKNIIGGGPEEEN